MSIRVLPTPFKEDSTVFDGKVYDYELGDEIIDFGPSPIGVTFWRKIEITNKGRQVWVWFESRNEPENNRGVGDLPTKKAPVVFVCVCWELRGASFVHRCGEPV